MTGEAICKKCLSAIEHSTQMPLKPLEDFELIHIDGLEISYKNLHAKNPEPVKISAMKLKLYLISNLSIGYNAWS
uniref:Uncharacterized protein n=1 Tax=Acrobeloides nanus TaxID=290746 RepID=A0A914CFF6_9BILA